MYVVQYVQGVGRCFVYEQNVIVRSWESFQVFVSLSFLRSLAVLVRSCLFLSVLSFLRSFILCTTDQTPNLTREALTPHHTQGTLLVE